MQNDLIADLATRLQERLQQPLPGWPAQSKMSHLMRTQFSMDIPEDKRDAAVLIALYALDGDWHFTLIERSSKIGHDMHRGQIAFPGGKVEDADADFWQAALREGQEEVGINPDAVQFIGALSPIYIPVSSFLVHPMIGVLDSPPDYVLQASEVQAVFATPLGWLLEDARIKFQTMTVWGGKHVLEDVPYFDFHDQVVWGATAIILSEFKAVLIEA
jgi:8-oxo-dGTP pyrophosphatase MutT (NUDIX family)